MSITYRTTGAWGSGIGQDLSAAQVDGNFYNLDGRISDLEANPPEAVSIEGITSTSTTLTVQLSNGSTQGPFKLPVATFNYRGAWTTATAYAINDIVSDSNFAAYVVQVAHTTTGTAINPALTINSVAVYQKILPEANTLLYRGIWQPNTVYYKNHLVRINGIGLYLINLEHTSQSIFFDEYTIGGLSVYSLVLQEAYPSTPVVNITTSQTLTLSDQYLGKMINYTGTGELTVELLTLSTTFWPIGGEVHFLQNTLDANKIVIDTATSDYDIIWPYDSYGAKTKGLGAVMTLKRISSTEWALFGLLGDLT